MEPAKYFIKTPEKPRHQGGKDINYEFTRNAMASATSFRVLLFKYVLPHRNEKVVQAGGISAGIHLKRQTGILKRAATCQRTSDLNLPCSRKA